MFESEEIIFNDKEYIRTEYISVRDATKTSHTELTDVKIIDKITGNRLAYKQYITYVHNYGQGADEVRTKEDIVLQDEIKYFEKDR